MSRLRTALGKEGLQLLVSLPSNDVELAKAALAEGADGLKVHMNVSHRASGNSFGPLGHYEATFQEIRSLYEGPFGIVPGGAMAEVKRDEIEKLPALGVDFFSIYAHHMSTFLLGAKGLSKTFATDPAFDLKLVEGAKAFGMDALEASIIPGDEYGSPLHFGDLMKYRFLVQHARVPVIVPSQRKLTPEDVPALSECGVKALLIGAVVTGRSKEGIQRAVSAFREAIDRTSGGSL
ncbi:hypothetical protein [Paenibacillus roseipurpureus]|uniref:Uncharacterized protein n=1 Tax=Paenibacillus roseopurpureus TaxID=2918901 RepID=A0AA96LS12_9BACL|nr:hypothetical protein [Paenibacillus sp. MBLB1832]WNR44848.1 hypothetical protein MJB10_01475 [Paenibacillus sp. MBLB1832]